MSATLKLTHKAIGAEVRRGTYDVVFDGERVGSIEMNHTIEIPVEPGRHTLQVRNGRNSSSTQTFDAAEGEIVAFRCGLKADSRSTAPPHRERGLRTSGACPEMSWPNRQATRRGNRLPLRRIKGSDVGLCTAGLCVMT